MTKLQRLAILREAAKRAIRKLWNLGLVLTASAEVRLDACARPGQRALAWERTGFGS